MDEIDVANGGNYEGFEGAGGETLDDSSSKEIFVVDLGFSNGGSDDIKECGDQEDGTFPVLSTQRANERARTAGG